jgi:peptide/nickel transport system substrate-binding protein
MVSGPPLYGSVIRFASGRVIGSMRRTRATALVALGTAASVVLAGCGGGGSGPAAPAPAPSTQNFDPGTVGKIDGPYNRPQVTDIGDVAVTVDEGFQDYNNNTGAANSLANTYVNPLLQPSPYFVDENLVLRIDRDYMESVTVTSTDPQVIEWKWRPDAVWSDGQPIGCKDMYLLWLAANVTAKDGDAQIFDSTPTGYDRVSGISCSPDGKTVTTTFGQPYADYRGLFSVAGQAGSQLLPAHILEQRTGIPDITKIDPKVDNEQLRAAGKFFTTGWNGFDAAVALSGGPYRIESSTRNDTTVLVRNERWWANPGGPARITISAVTDSQANVQKLLNKEAQVIAPQAESAIAEQIRAQGGEFTVFARGGQTYEHIDFQMTNPLFRDNPELRKAVASCVNRQDLVDKLIKSVDPAAVPLGNFVFQPNETGFEDHYAGVGTGDAATAKTLLEGAGWTLGPDGVYAKNGQRASFRLGFKLVDRRAQTAQLVAASCKPAGIEVIADPAEDFNDRRLPAGDFDAALFAWVGSPIKSSVVPNYISKAAGGTANYNNYSNPKFDEVFLASNGELDFAKRTQLFNDADKIMAEDMHSIPLFQLPDFAAADRTIGPVSYLGFGGGPLWNAFAWQKGQ